jgi:hypothetical protein
MGLRATCSDEMWHIDSIVIRLRSLAMSHYAPASSAGSHLSKQSS